MYSIKTEVMSHQDCIREEEADISSIEKTKQTSRILPKIDARAGQGPASTCRIPSPWARRQSWPPALGHAGQSPPALYPLGCRVHCPGHERDEGDTPRRSAANSTASPWAPAKRP